MRALSSPSRLAPKITSIFITYVTQGSVLQQSGLAHSPYSVNKMLTRTLLVVQSFERYPPLQLSWTHLSYCSPSQVSLILIQSFQNVEKCSLLLVPIFTA